MFADVSKCGSYEKDKGGKGDGGLKAHSVHSAGDSKAAPVTGRCA